VNISFAPLRTDAVEYLTDRIGVDFSYGSFQPPNWFCVTARDDEGQIMGVLAAEFQTWFDAKFYTAISNQRCMSKRLLTAIFTALFAQAVRITAEIDTDNRRALRQMQRMGFVYEGFCRLGINGNRDALVFGMLRQDCKYLPGYTGGTTRTLEAHYGQGTEGPGSVRYS
jgi:hypothetical protein